ncbi:MAG: macro domain-containing protein [Armatimonadetes bacterium]|nr:macro domain-containing protein [Armatimonadota bacterium]
MSDIRIILCDNHLPVVEAWQAYFDGLADVDITCDEIFTVEADALVSPANSFGRMDGGLDAQIVEFLGEDVEIEVQRMIRERHDGELVVGLAEVIITNAPQFPFLIVAPTMRVPQNITRTVNAYLAFRAALRAALAFNDLHGHAINTLLVPGLGTANGFMPPLRAARQMRAAYDAVLCGAPPNLDISLDAGADSDDKFTVRANEAAVPRQGDV